MKSAFLGGCNSNFLYKIRQGNFWILYRAKTVQCEKGICKKGRAKETNRAVQIANFPLTLWSLDGVLREGNRLKQRISRLEEEHPNAAKKHNKNSCSLVAVVVALTVPVTFLTCVTAAVVKNAVWTVDICRFFEVCEFLTDRHDNKVEIHWIFQTGRGTSQRCKKAQQKQLLASGGGSCRNSAGNFFCTMGYMRYRRGKKCSLNGQRFPKSASFWPIVMTTKWWSFNDTFIEFAGEKDYTKETSFQYERVYCVVYPNETPAKVYQAPTHFQACSSRRIEAGKKESESFGKFSCSRVRQNRREKIYRFLHQIFTSLFLR